MKTSLVLKAISTLLVLLATLLELYDLQIIKSKKAVAPYLWAVVFNQIAYYLTLEKEQGLYVGSFGISLGE